MNYQFYKDEREEHRIALGIYAGRMQYKSAWDAVDALVQQQPTIGGRELETQIPYLKYIDQQCDNINLVEDNKGLFCNHCLHYHAKFNLKGIVRVYEPLPQRGYDTPEQKFINPGKYRSDWTDNDVCFDDPYPDEMPPVDLA